MRRRASGGAGVRRVHGDGWTLMGHHEKSGMAARPPRARPRPSHPGKSHGSGASCTTASSAAQQRADGRATSDGTARHWVPAMSAAAGPALHSARSSASAPRTTDMVGRRMKYGMGDKAGRRHFVVSMGLVPCLVTLGRRRTRTRDYTRVRQSLSHTAHGKGAVCRLWHIVVP